MVDRRTFATTAVAALAATAIPRFEAIAAPDKLSIEDLLAAYDGLQAAMDALLGIANQPRSDGKAGEYLDAVREQLYLCTEPLVAAVKAMKPADKYASHRRCELLLRHALDTELIPEEIIAITQECIA